MPTSLFIEHRSTGLAFYINGNLQFDSADEAIYHEYLVVPAIALAAQRFPDTPLRVLICGGGDGLAARDALRFSQVSEVTLVDYNPDVLELGRTVFAPYNQGSLVSDPDSVLGESRVAVYTQEAFSFVSNLPDSCFHVVISDFTSPTAQAETQVYSREWFHQVQRVLYPGGVLAVNAVSPDHTTTAFWCLYQTLFAAGFHPKPMQISIPSFHQHSYGNWGFLLAATTPIARTELESLSLPSELRAFNPEIWLEVFRFPAAIAQHRQFVNIHTLECPQLLYYLLNPQATSSSLPKLPPSPPGLEDSEVKSLPELGDGVCDTFKTSSEEVIDFLDIKESGTNAVGTVDYLQLDALAKLWIEQLHQPETAKKIPPNLEKLIPVQHPHHDSKMVTEWMGYLKSLLEEIDINQLLSTLLERAKELPPQVVRDLKQLAETIRTGQPLTSITQHTAELVTILSVTLIMANLSAPDAVFAKGYSGRSYSGGSSSGGGSADVDYYYSEDGQFGWFGFWMMVIGGIWLWNLYRDE